MKKSYMKPEVNEIEVAANQAVAACGKRCSGYDNSWARGNNGQYGWPTTDQAWKTYDQYESFEYRDTTSKVDGAPFVFPVYYGETYSEAEQKIVYGTFHDLNGNGVMDGGEYVAWQEGDYNAVAAVLSGNVAAVVAS